MNAVWAVHGVWLQLLQVLLIKRRTFIHDVYFGHDNGYARMILTY